MSQSERPIIKVDKESNVEMLAGLLAIQEAVESLRNDVGKLPLVTIRNCDVSEDNGISITKCGQYLVNLMQIVSIREHSENITLINLVDGTQIHVSMTLEQVIGEIMPFTSNKVIGE